MSEAFAFGGRRVRVIDLGQSLSNTTTAFEPMPDVIEYFDHADTVAVTARESRCPTSSSIAEL
jgi:hypothetical protein